MNSRLSGLTIALCATLLSSAAVAAPVIVLPADVGTVPGLNQWYRTNFRDVSTGFTSNTTGAITGANPRDGNGSVQMTSTDGTGKVDFAYIWGFVSGRTLGNLNTLSYDWYRSSTSTNPGAQQPAFRLVYDADGASATVDDRGYLIWESTYNGGGATVATDQWVSSNMLGGNFWQRQFSPGFTVENYETNLNEWMNGPRPVDGDVLSAITAILGIEFGIGSGWNGVFNGYVDNPTFRFGTEAVSTFNFELRAPNAVPEPGGLALFGLGLAAWRFVPRRKGTGG